MSSLEKVLFDLKLALANLPQSEKINLLNTVGSECGRQVSIIQEKSQIPFVEVVEDDRDILDGCPDTNREVAREDKDTRTDASREVDTAV